ncbi:MAG: hypothetical protein ABEJ67_03265 [Halanaeroarchaeum sp.]
MSSVASDQDANERSLEEICETILENGAATERGEILVRALRDAAHDEEL